MPNCTIRLNDASVYNKVNEHKPVKVNIEEEEDLIVKIMLKVSVFPPVN